ncbi:glutamine amidotransferase of anthranilate synthase [Denitrovibrio acetiphilus DSM 12809]|uniref:Glutamine amidotransferase of anthranilate synthase n=1 Tax=Denitrovibrio acetiphilus (strain DSM 12809 / NBRC 114555 / N2460) TaxID=522772 RepID=D4H7E6_DENA2|nr:aminodeoxychorismate/anthranilate synthase component II [Denitrovibrio acetiphilus]ADD67945.1 glutamine amidotransferase of anthranilate synthase [Denitrovibrio acetiphilus DSM 12809]
MFLMVDNYDSFTYNLVALFRLNGAKVDVIRNTEYKDANEYQGIILSPGPSNPANSGSTLEYLDKYAGRTPIFGVCLGMQSIGHYLGYEVRRAKSVMHGKVDNIKLTGDSKILSGVKDDFATVRYHSLAVAAPEEMIIAKASADGECMAIEDDSKLLYGVQFHPESILSEHGDSIVKNFMNICGVEA